jgi:acyl-CoA thioesterase-1
MRKSHFSAIFLTIALLAITAMLGSSSSSLRAEAPSVSDPATAATPASPAAVKPALPNSAISRAGTAAAERAATAAKPALCSAPADLARLARPLTRIARRLAAGEPIKIVAVGSSSTAGAGASSPAASYPSRLAQELKQWFPVTEITVLNRGVNGEEVAEMLARLETDVIQEKPDLVLWQIGTNAVLRDNSLDRVRQLIQEGVRRLKAVGADVVLMDPQFSPKVIVKPEADPMVDLIARTAKQADIGVFHRFAVMQHWHDIEGLEFGVFVAPDQLHMNDWGYACVAKLLGGGIAEAVGRSAAVAHINLPPPH